MDQLSYQKILYKLKEYHYSGLVNIISDHFYPPPIEQICSFFKNYKNVIESDAQKAFNANIKWFDRNDDEKLYTYITINFFDIFPLQNLQVLSQMTEQQEVELYDYYENYKNAVINDC